MNRVMKAALCAATAVGCASSANATTFVKYDIFASGTGSEIRCDQGVCQAKYPQAWSFGFIATADSVESGKIFSGSPNVFFGYGGVSSVTVTATTVTLLANVIAGNNFSATLCTAPAAAADCGKAHFEITGPRGEAFQSFSGTINQYIISTFDADASEVGLIRSTPAVPEPATWALMLSGLSMAAYALRRRRLSVAIA